LSDSNIIALYEARSENAINETQAKYNAYLTKIAGNILADSRDSEECVNDTYLQAWNSIPPHRPENLAAYLGKIARNLSLNAVRNSSRLKRQSNQRALSLSELQDCIPSGMGNPEQAAEANLLTSKINEWLKTLPEQNAKLFVARYFFMDSVKVLAARYDLSESNAKVTLHRLRIALKSYLEKEGFMI